MITVLKFGGSSVSSADSFKKIKDIISRDKERRVVVSSAIGKAKDTDNKITDLLYLLHAHYKYKVNYENVFNSIKTRFFEIKKELGLKINLDDEFKTIESNLGDEAYLVSRGEFLTSLMLSEYLEFDFIDSKDIIKFDYNGKINLDETYKLINEKIDGSKGVVVPGFYGSYPNGEIKLFSRGGSDISGAILSKALNAKKYENYTDVNGLYAASPKIVENPKMIKEITYDELRELSYMGASVIHEETIYPIQEANIPLYILNTFNPDGGGTLINNNVSNDGPIITGVAGKENFYAINIIKNKSSDKLDCINYCLDVLKRFNVTIESIPMSVDSFGLVIEKNKAKNKIYDIISELKKNQDIISVSIDEDLSLIAIVGRNMMYKPGISAKLFALFGKNSINIKLISQNISEISIIIGVRNEDFNKAINAIYDGMIK